MAPPQQSKQSAKPAVTFRTEPERGEMKVSVLNICDSFSADIRRLANPQTTMPAKRPQPSVSYVTSQAANPVTVSKEPQTPTTMLKIGSWLNKNRVSRRTGSSTKHLIGHSPRLRPLVLAGAPSSSSASV